MKWNHRAHGEESFAACTQNQRRHKANEDNMTFIKQVAMCPPRLSCFELGLGLKILFATMH